MEDLVLPSHLLVQHPADMEVTSAAHQHSQDREAAATAEAEAQPVQIQQLIPLGHSALLSAQQTLEVNPAEEGKISVLNKNS